MEDQSRELVPVAAMFRHDDLIRIASIGIENQTKIDQATPLHSVLTFVLYFGSERKRIRPRSLFETTQLVSALTGNTDIERRFAEDMKGAPE